MLKETLKTPEQSQWHYSHVFIVVFEYIAHLFVVCLFLNFNK